MRVLLIHVYNGRTEYLHACTVTYLLNMIVSITLESTAYINYGIKKYSNPSLIHPRLIRPPG